ncbi:MAG TPA: MMPL family transporter, partial [Candidatus Polarisedimenticolaceae bacterium]|nr:MMPL family transporter [Candidatus Polarisedimenticolaceae bacterium]
MTTPSAGPPKLGHKHRILLRIERFSRQHYGVVFSLALLALVGGIWLGSRLKLESDILALIPEGNRQVDTLRKALADFGSIDYLLVLLEAGEGEGPDELEDFADRFADRLVGLDELIEYVEYRFELDDDFLELFYRNAVLFLPPDRLGELAAKLTDEAIAERLSRLKLELSSPMASLTQDLVVNDPLRLMPLFLNRLEGNRGVLKVDLSDGYYLSQDARTLIMLVKPVGPSQNLEFDRRLMGAVRALEDEVRRELALEASAGEGGPHRVGVRYGGNYAIALDEEALIRQDVSRNLIVSLIAVSALYWLCYRRFAALLYSSLPLLVGQALTFAVAFFALRQLNASSSAFTALLMGLGTDFVIVMYARYVEERRRGRTLAEATELMIGETGLGVFTGAITSAGTFYAMCTSEFQGLWDLGFLIGGGILLCAVAIVFMLPAMIKWNEGVRPRRTDSLRKLHLQSFGLERLITLSVRYRRLTLVSLALITAVSGYLATRLGFDDTITVLRSERSEALKVQDDVRKMFGASLSYMMAIAEGETLDEAIALTSRIDERLQPFIEDGTVASSDSVLSYLPPLDEQLQVLAALREDETGAFDVERIRAALASGLAQQRFRPDAFSEFTDRLETFLRPERPVRIEDLQQQGLQRLLDRYVALDDGRHRVVTYMFLTDRRWKREAPPGLVDALTAGDRDIVVTGTNILGQELRGLFAREAPRAVLLGLAVVFLLLWVDFRSIRLTAIAMMQLICGVTIMLGVMKVAGINLNYVNAFVATMILGVGIDYS